MTKIEMVYWMLKDLCEEEKIFEVANLECPSDYGLEDSFECFNEDGVQIGDCSNCFECWMDEVKEKEITIGEFKLVQAYNGHIHIYENGKFAMHINQDEKELTEEYAKDCIDLLKDVREWQK